MMSSAFGFGFLAVLPESLLLLWGEHLIETSWILSRWEVSVCAISVLKFNNFNLRGSSCNIHLLCSWTLLHHYHEIRSAEVEVNAVGVIRFANLNRSLEGGFVYFSKKVAFMGSDINSSVTIILEVLHLLEDLFMAGNLCLEFVVLEFPLVLEGTELLFKLPSATLNPDQEEILEFLERSADIAGLVERVDAGLGTMILSPAKQMAKSRTQLKDCKSDMSSSNLVSTPL